MALDYRNQRCIPIWDIRADSKEIKGILYRVRIIGDDATTGFYFPPDANACRTIGSHFNGKASILRWLSMANFAATVLSFKLIHYQPGDPNGPFFLDTIVSMGRLEPMRYPLDLPCSGDVWRYYDYVGSQFLNASSATTIIASTDYLDVVGYFEVI